MKKNHLLATMKLCLMATVSSALLFTSCAKDGFDDETWSSDVKNTQLQSPQPNDITIAATTDKSKTVISWKAIGGARAYKVIVNNVTEQTPVVVVDSIIDGVSFTIPRPEDSNFTMSILTLANTGLGNTDAETATVVNFTSFVERYGNIIPSGTDLSAYFKKKFTVPTDLDLPDEFCFDLEPGGTFTISDSLDFASVTEDGSISYPVTLRCTDKNNRPTITIASTTVTNPEDGTEITRYGRISTTVPLTLQNLNFDYSIIPDDQAEKTAAIFLSDETNLPVVGSTFKYVIKGGAVQCKNCDFTGLKGMFLFDNNKQNYCIETFILDNCRIQFQTPKSISSKAFFYMQKSFVKDFYIRNSTLCNTGAGNIQYVISYNNSGRIDRAGYDRTVETESVNITNSTLYNIGYGNFANYPGFAGQAYTCFDIQNNIFVDAGKGGSGVARRILGGRNASSYTKKCVFSQNTYWTNGAAEKEGAPLSVEGATEQYDTSHSALQTDPALTNPANGDLTPTGLEQVEKKTGDPYWFN